MFKQKAFELVEQYISGWKQNNLPLITACLTEDCIVIAAIDGQLTVKRLIIKSKQLFLIPENKKFKPIPVTEENNMIIWGVVTNVIHAV